MEIKNYITKENGELNLDLEITKKLASIKLEYPFLPFTIKNDFIIFNPFIVGSIQLDNINIVINPRHSYTIKDIFEMKTFLDTEKYDFAQFSSLGFEKNNSFGIEFLIKNFILYLKKLLEFGLTGNYISEKNYSFNIKGRIILEKYHKPLNSIFGIFQETEYYSKDIKQNQVLKLALNKIKQGILRDNFLLEAEIDELLCFFSDISFQTLAEDDLTSELIHSFYSANSYYPIVLEYALNILNNVTLNYDCGNYTFKAFLLNSNNLFEDYVRKVLEISLDESVKKWSQPKKFTKFYYGMNEFEKSYSPDILIDYNEEEYTVRAIFDVKNKEILTQENIDISNPDIYQIYFYCTQLSCSTGGLIYPTKYYAPPLLINLPYKEKLKCFIIFLDMDIDIEERNKKLIKDIKNCFI